MRIRGTKPEFWKSKRIASVSWADRLLLKGLESYVDDNGVGVDDVELIVTDVFPRDMFASPRETIARVSEGISRLHQAGLVWRYTHEDDHLLYISFWEDIQRIDKPGKGRNPRPDGTWDYKESSIRESVASPPETVAPVTGEQGNRGTVFFVSEAAGGGQATARRRRATVPTPERPHLGQHRQDPQHHQQVAHRSTPPPRPGRDRIRRSRPGPRLVPGRPLLERQHPVDAEVPGEVHAVADQVAAVERHPLPGPPVCV